MNDSCTVRITRGEDRETILDIYNFYVENSPCTFDTRRFTLQQREGWFSQFDGKRHVCLVAEQQQRVVGYACSMRFKEKPAYWPSVEMSVYTSRHAAAHGIGTALYAQLICHLEQQSVHRAYAGITLPNDASVALHEKFGFTRIGVFNQVGYKFGEFWDVAWYERPFA